MGWEVGGGVLGVGGEDYLLFVWSRRSHGWRDRTHMEGAQNTGIKIRGAQGKGRILQAEGVMGCLAESNFRVGGHSCRMDQN